MFHTGSTLWRHTSVTFLRLAAFLYKTPDVKLCYPIAVPSPHGDGWVMVHWIDSKAMFGDTYGFIKRV